MRGNCFICKKHRELEIHHCVPGTANRKLSEKYNLKVGLCAECHRTGKTSVHKDSGTMAKMQRAAQRAFERVYTREEFIKIFGRNYL